MKYKTLKAIAKEIKRPATTVRRWASEFEDYLSPHKPEKRRFPVYPHTDAEVLQLIGNSYDEGLQTDGVKEKLGELFGEPAETEQPQDNTQSATEQQPYLTRVNRGGTPPLQQLHDNYVKWQQNQDQLLDYYMKQCEKQRLVIDELKRTVLELERGDDTNVKKGLIQRLFHKD